MRPVDVYAQAGICGPFTDVLASDVFCPFILQAFNLGVTNGTGNGTTFSPNDTIPRNQVVTFFDRGVDFAIHRGKRTAIGRTWGPTSSVGGASLDVGAQVLDVVSDGEFLWVARNDSVILKVNGSDRRILETWRITAGAVPTKLGIYAGQVWIADQLGNLYVFDPSQPPTTKSSLISGASAGFPTLAFDGTNVWLAGATGNKYLRYQVNASGGFITTAPANVESLLFDGTFMWMLLSNNHLQKVNAPAQSVTPSVIEDITMPAAVSDCRMVWDGNNLWIPVGGVGRLFVVRPSQGSFPSQVVLNQAMIANFPYVASFDGENIMVGGVNDGQVTIFKATSLALLRSFNAGPVGVRSIASDGLTFTIGDSSGTKIFQF